MASFLSRPQCVLNHHTDKRWPKMTAQLKIYGMHNFTNHVHIYRTLCTFIFYHTITHMHICIYITHIYVYMIYMISNGNIFRITGPSCGEFTGPGAFPAQRPVTRNFGVFFNLRMNKRLSKQPCDWWFETPSWSLWRQCNVSTKYQNGWPV